MCNVTWTTKPIEFINSSKEQVQTYIMLQIFNGEEKIRKFKQRSCCGSKENYKNGSKLNVRVIKFKQTNQLNSFPKNITWLPSEGKSMSYLDPIFSRRLFKS